MLFNIAIVLWWTFSCGNGDGELLAWTPYVYNALQYLICDLVDLIDLQDMWQDVDPDNMSYEVRFSSLLLTVCFQDLGVKCILKFCSHCVLMCFPIM